MSNQFFIDFVADYRGCRVLVDATIKLKAYFPKKTQLAEALRMGLYILHLSPKHLDLFWLSKIKPHHVVSRVPAAFIREKYEGVHPTIAEQKKVVDSRLEIL